MADRTLARLRVGDTVVMDYLDGGSLDESLAPRPYLHPLRTLAGTVVTDARPADHPWHLGLSVALQDVGGWNVWGGPTYAGGQGYVWRHDHGRVEHLGFDRLEEAGWTERLRWLTGPGEPLLQERRTVAARPAGRGWELTLTTTLTNATGRPLALASPATHGRSGAGYGGLFWRLPATGSPRVRTSTAEGEDGTHGSVTAWLAWTDGSAGFSLVLTGADPATRADPWFVRVQDYCGVGFQLAAERPALLPPGGAVTRGLRALVVDGELSDDEAEAFSGSR